MENVQQKKNQLTLELEQVVKNYNKLGKDREQLLTRANQIQGALTVLNELDGDLPTEARPS